MMLIALILTAHLSTFPCSKNEIFVSPTGNDRAVGTSADPVATLGKAADLAKETPSATIRLAAGNYIIQAPVVLAPGTSIVGSGDKSTQVIYQHAAVTQMDGNAFIANFAIQSTGGIGTIFRNFSLMAPGIDSRSAGGIYLKDSRNARIENVLFRSLVYAGLWLDGAENALVKHCVFDDCGRPSSSHCTPALAINDMTGGRITENQITENRGAYGIKSLKPEWEGDHWPKPVSNMRNLRIDHNQIKLRQSGAWGNGQPNMAIEFWNCRSQTVEIDHNQINVCTSLVGESTPVNSYRVHHNRFLLEPGYTYALELSVNNIDVTSNYFSNGCYPIANFGPLIENIQIRNNIFENIESVRVLSFGSGIRRSLFSNNTVAVAKPIPLFLIDSGKDDGLTITKNIFVSAGNRNRTTRESSGSLRGISDNVFVNWDPVGDGAKSAITAFAGSGGKPWPFYRPTAAATGYGAQP